MWNTAYLCQGYTMFWIHYCGKTVFLNPKKDLDVHLKFRFAYKILFHETPVQWPKLPFKQDTLFLTQPGQSVWFVGTDVRSVFFYLKDKVLKTDQKVYM